MNNVLANPPKYFRAPISRGGQPRVEREGGYRNAGLIRGVSVITKGEALGHDLWIDDMALEQVEALINFQRNGVKSRFTHPSMSGDGLGKHVARVRDAEVAGDQVFADQHFLQSAHKTPDGDLAEYLMTLAEEDPESYGLSISFLHDAEAMEQFATEHSVDGAFRSPDPQNVNHYRHVRIKELHAADSVDEPAANPNGLFHREGDIAKDADAFVAYALGQSNERPETQLDLLDPDRARGFMARFFNVHNLEIKEKVMEATTVDESTNVEDESTVDVAAESTTETEAPQTETTEPAMDARDEAAQFLKAFGPRGAVAYAEGLSFEACREEMLEVLRSENERLRQKLSARPVDGEDSPVTFDAQESKGKGALSSYLR